MVPGDYGFGEDHDEPEPPRSWARDLAEVVLLLGGCLLVVAFSIWMH